MGLRSKKTTRSQRRKQRRSRKQRGGDFFGISAKQFGFTGPGVKDFIRRATPDQINRLANTFTEASKDLQYPYVDTCDYENIECRKTKMLSYYEVGIFNNHETDANRFKDAIKYKIFEIKPVST